MRFRAKFDEPKTFGQRLNNVLAEKKLSTVQFTEDEVCSDGAIRKYIYSGTMPNATQLARLCEYMDESADYLLGLKGKAKWIFFDGECICSHCRNRGETTFRWCPNCGWKMKEETDDT